MKVRTVRICMLIGCLQLSVYAHGSVITAVIKQCAVHLGDSLPSAKVWQVCSAGPAGCGRVGGHGAAV